VSSEASSRIDAGQEGYALGYSSEAQNQYLGQRTASDWIPFLLPYLRPGLDVLDCGCGPGSITVDVAQRVAPGLVVGIDVDAAQVERARRLARERGITNIRFEVGTVYELPFPDATFDAAYANNVLNHLADPLSVLREMRRVLKAGGVVGISDTVGDDLLLTPTNPLLERAVAHYRQVKYHNGAGREYNSPCLRQYLAETGFVRSIGYALGPQCYGTPEATRHLAQTMVLYFGSEGFRDVVLSQGWAGAALLDEVVRAFQAWGERSDSFHAALNCAAVGWVAG
jgi:ubiquinone/menaquinone biosynthesis C-methylase UbiE